MKSTGNMHNVATRFIFDPIITSTCFQISFDVTHITYTKRVNEYFEKSTFLPTICQPSPYPAITLRCDCGDRTVNGIPGKMYTH